MKRTFSTLFKFPATHGLISKWASAALVVIAIMFGSNNASAQTYLPSGQAIQLLTGTVRDLRGALNSTSSSAPNYKALEVKFALYKQILVNVKAGKTVQVSFEEGFRDISDASVAFYNLDANIKKEAYLEAFDLLTI